MNWYGLVQRMSKEMLPPKNMKWCPLGRRRRNERPQNSWIKEIIGIRQKEINSTEWIEREECRRKITLKLQGQKGVKTLIFCTQIKFELLLLLLLLL